MRELPHTVVTAIEAASIPPLPQVLVRLIQQVDNESATISELATAVGQDPGLCARVLTAANSVAFNRASAIRDVKSSVSILGTRLVRSIATCLAVKRLFEREPGAVCVDLTDFWRHSMLVAETARALATATDYPYPDEAYLAGLLHDVGELLLLTALGEQYARLLAQCPDENSLLELEQANLGTHHGEIGTWLADQWKLDSSLADSILFHHATAEQIATATPLPKLIWLADAITRNAAAEEPLDTLAAPLFGPGHDLDLANILAQSLEHVTVISKALGIEAPRPQTDAGPVRTLPSVIVLPAPVGRTEADDFLEAMVHDMAVMHPLQQDLFGLESDTELLLSLRESARILFELPRLGFLLINADSGVLSGNLVGGQPNVFRQTELASGADAGLVTRAISRRAVLGSFDEPAHPDSLLDSQFARAFFSEGILALPMIGKRRTLGVMVFGVSKAQYGRLKKRARWLLNFGRIGGVSLEAWQDAMAYRKQAEDEASAAFQRQARRIVHEAGNPLGIIKSYLRILDQKLPENSEVRQEIDVLGEEIDRVAGIVRRLSELPPSHATVTAVNAVELVRELLALYRVALFGERGIVVRSQFGAATPATVACDANSLKQILVNLWKNACEAMPNGGRFDIAINGVVHNGRQHVEIRMLDTGPGMPEEAIRKLSFPEDAHATAERGLGLSIVGKLAAKIGCNITCRSKAGVGTTLSLLLPCDANG
ncbi:HDOD domain-containing protein [Aromatoleum diolicum]|uniref:histidine kinase n=1 Tax=Aromatoleum diolicum TaxID=75796 RepID=A0ABX1QHE2_9RHOO|nr:HDOD domain-containing protein [Aromatoleum diolicum]NMG76955.1 HDOD domain-containing protein [Aromatoleum diolicum]